MKGSYQKQLAKLEKTDNTVNADLISVTSKTTFRRSLYKDEVTLQPSIN